MMPFKRLSNLYRKLNHILGAPGMMIGGFSVVSFFFGLYIVASEYNLPRRTGRDVVRKVVGDWIRRPDYLGLTLIDYADQYREPTSPNDNDNEPQSRLRNALLQLGTELDLQADQLPLIRMTGMEVRSEDATPLAEWQSSTILNKGNDEVVDTIRLIGAEPGKRPTSLRFYYRVATPFENAANGLESSFRRLLLGLLGLSGFSLLCLGYMIFQAKSLSERTAREAAQDATLDLADRTCHELGNGIFILANEQRNLSQHLDLVQRFIDEEPIARDLAARRTGLDGEQAKRLAHALERERRVREIDPESAIRSSVAITRSVADRIKTCAAYIGMTVRELDGFLKRSELPVEFAEVSIQEAIDEAVALLEPRLEASALRVDQAIGPPGLSVMSDRRLLIHVLVNLIKNAIEAVESAGSVASGSAIRIEARVCDVDVEIAVADRGPGIPQKARERIFDVGYSTKGRGRGRGLAIVLESIRLLDAALEVNDREGGGAVFSFRLPKA